MQRKTAIMRYDGEIYEPSLTVITKTNDLL